MRTTPGWRVGTVVRRPIRRSARAAIYANAGERRWSLYGRWLEWFGRKGVLRVTALLAGAIALALLNAPDVAVGIGSLTDLADMAERDGLVWDSQGPL